VAKEAEQILLSYGAGSGHIFNLGHGISQFTPPENVSVLVETVREKSRAFHSAS
jgi:uroporphyrinogen decarboxylase